MRYAVTAFFVAGLVIGTQPALAQLTKDDTKWINQCITDNKGGAAEPIIRKYCFCMNEKMDDNETKTITQWEKVHPVERAACDKESGWK
jgi:hypothetical protein